MKEPWKLTPEQFKERRIAEKYISYLLNKNFKLSKFDRDKILKLPFDEIKDHHHFILFSEDYPDLFADDYQLALDFVPGNKDVPIAKTFDGKICILDLNYCKKNKVWIKVGETWRCKVVTEEDKKIIVQPLYILFSIEENEMLFKSKTEALKEKYGANWYFWMDN